MTTGSLPLSVFWKEICLNENPDLFRMGADGVELDVQVCRSGELVVAHDETVDRVSDGSGRICDHSLKELKSLAFCRTHPEYKNARLPLLSEVFQLLQPSGLSVNIELKNSIIDYPDLERKVLEEVLRNFNPERIIFSSFNHYSISGPGNTLPGWGWMRSTPIIPKSFWPLMNAFLPIWPAFA